jgi:hypothetical protein
VSEDKDYGSLRSQSVAVKLPCRVYWGSHGCRFERGHDGQHECECARDEAGNPVPRVQEDEDGEFLNVGRAPYYGPDTRFYGEEAEALGLPLVE